MTISKNTITMTFATLIFSVPGIAHAAVAVNGQSQKVSATQTLTKCAQSTCDYDSTGTAGHEIARRLLTMGW